jgi:RNA polymerase sigma-70 factor (ECF subfamily)
MASEMPEQNLMSRIAARDEDALAELYDDLAPRLLGLIRRILGSREEAEEVLQGVFLRVWNEESRQLPTPARTPCYLVQLARDMALQRLKPSIPGRGPAPDKNRGLPQVRWQPPPEIIPIVEERRAFLSKIFFQLPALQRDGIERVVFEGLSEKEVAVFHAEPLGRAQDELRAGLAFLRQRLLTLVGTWTAGI